LTYPGISNLTQSNFQFVKLKHFNFSNQPIETRRFPRINTLKLSICQFETVGFVNSTNPNFPDSRKNTLFFDLTGIAWELFYEIDIGESLQ